MMESAVREHEWLKRFVGKWRYESECPAEPGGPPVKFDGTETVRAVGDLWVVGESKGEMPGGEEATMIMTVGFNIAAQKYVGMWIGSMMTHMWVYSGWLEGDNTLVLEAEGPRFDDPSKKTKYRDITVFKTPDHRAFRSEVLGEDGKWTQLMSMDFYRVK